MKTIAIKIDVTARRVPNPLVKVEWENCVFYRHVPERPWKSLEEARSEAVRQSPNMKVTWPCSTCNGTGLIYDPNDPRDPIEGDKLRKVIACPDCDHGDCGREVFVKSYNEQIRKWRVEYETSVKSFRAAVRALKKLSMEEIKAIMDLNYSTFSLVAKTVRIKKAGFPNRRNQNCSKKS